MPFIGQDWRAPGETWIKIHEGWERMKLRPYGTEPNLEARFRPLSEILISGSDSQITRNASSEDFGESLTSLNGINVYKARIRQRLRTDSDSSVEQQPVFVGGADVSEADETESEDTEDWQPHCFVKTGKSKEFVGCTSMSEAFHKLNLARAVTEIRQFNYICKVVQILIRDKLHNLSGSARKILLSIVEAIVLHSLESYSELKTVRLMVGDFITGLSGGQHCGSPKLLTHHQDAVSDLCVLLETKQPSTPAECNEEAVTFLDLPRECLRAILRRLPDHECLLEAAKAHEALDSIVESEQRLWKGLCSFHFAEWQLVVAGRKLQETRKRLRGRRRAMGKENEEPREEEEKLEDGREYLARNWRHAFFELKKLYGLKDVYADMIHICCHCKALFWKSLGHPCVAKETAPSVRVTPQQFVDMLMLL